MKTSSLAMIMVVVMLAGCAAPLPQIDFYDTDSGTLRQYRSIVILPEAADRQHGYEDLGEVEGLYCNRTRAFSVDSPEAKRIAVDQAKLRAAAEGADAISAPVCETSTTWDLTNNCFATLTCRSQALAFDGN